MFSGRKRRVSQSTLQRTNDNGLGRERERKRNEKREIAVGKFSARGGTSAHSFHLSHLVVHYHLASVSLCNRKMARAASSSRAPQT